MIKLLVKAERNIVKSIRKSLQSLVCPLCRVKRKVVSSPEPDWCQYLVK